MISRTVSEERLEELDQLARSPLSVVAGVVTEALHKEIHDTDRIEFHRSDSGGRDAIARMAHGVELVIPRDIAIHGALD